MNKLFLWIAAASAFVFMLLRREDGANLLGAESNSRGKAPREENNG